MREMIETITFMPLIFRVIRVAVQSFRVACPGLNKAKEVQIEKLTPEKLVPCDTRDNRNHRSHGLHFHRDPLHRAELSCRRYQHAAGLAKR